MKKIIILALIIWLPAIALAEAPAGNTRSMADAFMKQLDKDGDGKVSRSEFLAPHEQQFQNMDSNHDGVVDRAEIGVVEKAWHERLQKMRKFPAEKR
jgi:Ca2+-binding EF-hand superfamily protein